MSTNDRRGDLSRAYEQDVTVVSGAKAEQLASPTPCPGFDVAALVDHLVGVGWRAAALGRGEAPTHDEFPHIELANAAEELRRSSKEAAAAWSDNARLAGTVIMPWGEAYVGTTLVNMYLAELSAHSWDLAVATGQVEALDPALATAALDGAREFLYPDARDLMGIGDPYGAEITPPEDATEWERFVAFMGRVPR